MEDIIVGSIVRPSTPVKRKLFGKGMVIELPNNRSSKYTVIFPSNVDMFVLYEFKRDFLQIVTTTPKTIKQINKALKVYNVLNEELKMRI